MVSVATPTGARDRQEEQQHTIISSPNKNVKYSIVCGQQDSIQRNQLVSKVISELKSEPSSMICGNQDMPHSHFGMKPAPPGPPELRKPTTIVRGGYEATATARETEETVQTTTAATEYVFSIR